LSPAASGARLPTGSRSGSVDAAHPVDRDFLDQQFIVFVEKVEIGDIVLDGGALESGGRHNDLLVQKPTRARRVL